LKGRKLSSQIQLRPAQPFAQPLSSPIGRLASQPATGQLIRTLKATLDPASRKKKETALFFGSAKLSSPRDALRLPVLSTQAIGIFSFRMGDFFLLESSCIFIRSPVIFHIFKACFKYIVLPFSTGVNYALKKRRSIAAGSFQKSY
jgi:hypothetical protein